MRVSLSLLPREPQSLVQDSRENGGNSLEYTRCNSWRFLGGVSVVKVIAVVLPALAYTFHNSDYSLELNSDYSLELCSRSHWPNVSFLICVTFQFYLNYLKSF